MKTKLKYIFIIIGLLIVVYFALRIYINRQTNYLFVRNLSSETISNVIIEVNDSETVIQRVLGTLYSSSEYKYKLTDEAFEKSVSVLYTDKNNNPQKEVVVPYWVPGENKNYEFEIK